VELVTGMKDVVVIGEGMIELSRADGAAESWVLRSGGDALNVAVYMARLGARVSFLTALGDDMMSRSMRAEWAAESLDMSMVLTVTGRQPGLYMIETDASGERSFHYWRENSAARAMFSADGIDAALERASTAACLYLSGITLSIFADEHRARLVRLCEDVARAGGTVAFDPNYRLRGWASAEAARAAIAAIAPFVNIVLPTLADETMLYGDTTVEACVERWMSLGIGEIAVKLGAEGVATHADGSTQIISGDLNPLPRDTTGAGDAFNAAYLCARLEGYCPSDSAHRGNRLASAVIRHSGAIIVKDARRCRTMLGEAHKRQAGRMEFGVIADPEVRAFFAKLSPINNVAKITTPMLVMHGANDALDPVT